MYLYMGLTTGGTQGARVPIVYFRYSTTFRADTKIQRQEMSGARVQIAPSILGTLTLK